MGLIAFGKSGQRAHIVARVWRYLPLIRSIIICLVISAPALAEDYIKPTQRPDPGTVRVPVLRAATDPNGAHDYDKFFVFWRPETSYESAFSDLDQCRIYGLETKLVASTPKYVPLGADEIKEPNSYIPYGYFMSGLLSDYLIDRALKDEYLQTEKRCMAYKGYDRFGVSRETWKEIMAGKDEDALARRALIAAGPQPATESVDP